MKYKITLNYKNIRYMDWLHAKQLFDYVCKLLGQQDIYMKVYRPEGVFEVYLECEEKPQLLGFKYANRFKIETI